MKRISFYKKLKLFFFYKKVLKKQKEDLERNLNIRLDDAYRMYTVLNIPENIIGDSYILKKSDRDVIAQAYIKEYTSTLSKYLNNNGLNELYSTYDIKKVDKYSYLIVIGYSLLQSEKLYDRLYYRVIPIVSLLLILSVIYFTLK
jgi:hypothetical protein